MRCNMLTHPPRIPEKATETDREAKSSLEIKLGEPPQEFCTRKADSDQHNDDR